MYILKEEDVIQLIEHWCVTDHVWLGKRYKTNNPSGYVKSPLYKSEEQTETYRKVRLEHLSELLELIYENYLAQEKFLDLSDVEKKRFKKYIYSEIIYNYPYKCFKNIAKEDVIIDKNLPGYADWLDEVFTYKNSVRTGHNKINAVSALHKVRREIMLKYFVAVVAHFINKIQVEDIKSNKAEDYIYGTKHALSAFLGQHIIRKFPFKEGIVFSSQAVVVDGPQRVIYEHWTPISFFRDLIWINEPNSKEPKVYSVDEWFRMLKFAYRTVVVSKEEDDRLNTGKYKSRRPFNAYQLVGIDICEKDKSLWQELHSL
jgi:hypothetical protein